MCCAALRLRISIAHWRDINNAVGRASAALAHVAALDCCDTVEIEVDPRSECYCLGTWYMVQVGLNAGRGGWGRYTARLYSGEVLITRVNGKKLYHAVSVTCYMLHVDFSPGGTRVCSRFIDSKDVFLFYSFLQLYEIDRARDEEEEKTVPRSECYMLHVTC